MSFLLKIKEIKTMKKEKTIKQLSIILTIIFCLAFIIKYDIDEVLAHTKSLITQSSPYFKKGVYLVYPKEDKNPPKDFFYIFYDEKSGHNEDGSMKGMGLPFACEQKEGIIKFSFGGADPEGLDYFKIESIEDGDIIGYFKDGKRLIFETLKNINHDKFDSEKYLKRQNRKFKFFKRFN